jgi:hypothetical protein
MISRVPQAKVIKPRRRYLRRTLDHFDAATKIVGGSGSGVKDGTTATKIRF